jgi:hypothetical protein
MTLATRCGVLCPLPWPPRVAAAMSSYLLTERGRCHNTSHDQICGQWRPIASSRFIHIVVVVGSSGKEAEGISVLGRQWCVNHLVRVPVKSARRLG